MAKRRRYRQQFRTVLIFGEGPDESAFVKHVRANFAHRTGNLQIMVRAGSGGSAADVLIGASRVPGQYDKRAAFLDRDRLLDGDRARARTLQIEILESVPNLEGLLLSVLGEPIPSSSAQCKRTIEKLCGDLVPSILARHFPKPLLQKAIGRSDPGIATLQRLIELVQNGT